MEEKVELYKIRTLGERFSATSDFVRENWRVVLKNILPAGIPLTLLMFFFMQSYIQNVFIHIGNPAALASISWFSYGNFTVASMLLSLFIYSMLGALLNKYAEGSLTPETGWADLKGVFFAIAGRLIIQYLMVVLCFFVLFIIAMIPFLFIPFGKSMVIGLFSICFMLIFLVVIVLVIPFFSLMQYPIYFELASAWESIKKAFRWSFRYWGSTFLTVLLAGLITVVVLYIFAMPYLVYLMFCMETFGWLGYLLGLFMGAANLLLMPICVIFLAFQYTSIAEREKNK